MLSKHALLVDLMHDVGRLIREQLREVLRDQGIPQPLMHVGRSLQAEPGITVSELARRTGLAKSNISTTIEELSRRGWVEKRTDPRDQRLLRLYLTRSAQDEWQRLRAAMQGRITELIAEIPDETTASLIDGLETLKAALEYSAQPHDKGRE